MISQRTSLFFYLCLLFLVMPALPASTGTAEARDYYIEKLDIDAEIGQDGRVSMTEVRRVRFEGNYSWLEQRFRKQGFSNLENVEVLLNGRPLRFNPDGRKEAVPGEYSIRETDNSIYVRAHMSAEDETVELELRYGLAGALAVNGDWAEFYWTFLGNGWGRTTSDISIQLRFPDAPENMRNELYAWQESRALAPELSIRDRQWQFTAERILKERSIRIRSIFPSAWADDAAMVPTNAELNPQAVQAQIEAERKAAEEALQRKRERAVFLVPLAYLLAFIALGLGVFMLYKYRFNHPQSGGATQKVPPMSDRPPSELEPALVGKLVGMNYSSSQYRLLATIFDLGRKGYFTFTPGEEPPAGNKKKPKKKKKKGKPVFLITRTEKNPEEALFSWEKDLIRFVEYRLKGETKSFKQLFKDKTDISFSFSKKEEKKEAKDVSTWLAAWEKAVGAEAETRNWRVNNEKPITVLILAESLLLLIGFFMMIYLEDVAGLLPGGLLALGSLIGGLLATGLSFYTPEGDYQFKRWMAYREGLKRQRVTADKAFKGRHIIYAIALNVSGKKLDALLKNLELEEGDLTWLIFMPGMFPNAALFSTAVSQAVTSTTTSVSTGGGAVGGAAGGGGGGGAG